MNTNYGLTYPKETDFYDINIFNSNFSALADGIDKAKNNNTVKSCLLYTSKKNIWIK